MSGDLQPPTPHFASRAERRRYERTQAKQAKRAPIKGPPRTRAQAEALVLPTRAQEMPERHIRGGRGTEGVTSYAFTVYRKDGGRAVGVLIDAKDAAHAQRRRKGETKVEAARRLAHKTGAAQLVADLMAGEPE
jgi:hypothetical protein